MGALLKLLRELGKRVFRRPRREPPRRQDQQCRSNCSQRSRQELERSRRSLEQRRDEHIQKLEDYRANPDAFDNQGHLARAGDNQALRERIINGRIRHLENEIANFERQIADITRALQ